MRFELIVAVLLVVACTPGSPTPVPTATHDINATVQAAVAAALPTPPVTPTPDIEATVGSEPVFVGTYGGECDRGPTSISAEPEVSAAAVPGTTLHYRTVPVLSFAARENKYATADCAYRVGVPAVYYTLHIRSVAELEAYGGLARNSSRFTLDRILATKVEPLVPTPTPGVCIRMQAYRMSKSGGGDAYVQWHPHEYPCRHGESAGSVRWGELEDEWKGLPQRSGTGKK